jgi:septal ring factor EnvC (AmiA/AmiB activator)
MASPKHPDCAAAQVSAARASLESQLAATRTDASGLCQQLGEARTSLAAAHDNAAVAEASAARLQEERVRLSRVRD